MPPPATEILNAPQYLTGKVLGDAAAAYIRDRLRGRANVVLLTHDSLQFLAPRFVAMRDSLKALPGVTVVADLSPATVSKEGGLAAMRTILLAHPNVDVVLGADTVVLGALEALRAAGKARPDQFLGGIDGEPEAVAEIRKGGPYKASISLASPVFAYALGQHAADWLEGKSIPQAMDILPSALTLGNIAQYEADLADPASVWRKPGAPRRLSQDVRQHLLRQPRPVFELSLVLGKALTPRHRPHRRRPVARCATSARHRLDIAPGSATLVATDEPGGTHERHRSPARPDCRGGRRGVHGSAIGFRPGRLSQQGHPARGRLPARRLDRRGGPACSPSA